MLNRDPAPRRRVIVIGDVTTDLVTLRSRCRRCDEPGASVASTGMT